jgi:hypothetical protein
MKTVTITCDTCERDITTTGNSVDYRLAVLSQSIPSRGGIVTDMMIYPVLDRDYYFCSLNCFREWAKRI